MKMVYLLVDKSLLEGMKDIHIEASRTDVEEDEAILGILGILAPAGAGDRMIIVSTVVVGLRRVQAHTVLPARAHRKAIQV